MKDLNEIFFFEKDFFWKDFWKDYEDLNERRIMNEIEARDVNI